MTLQNYILGIGHTKKNINGTFDCTLSDWLNLSKLYELDRKSRWVLDQIKSGLAITHQLIIPKFKPQ